MSKKNNSNNFLKNFILIIIIIALIVFMIVFIREIFKEDTTNNVQLAQNNEENGEEEATSVNEEPTAKPEDKAYKRNHLSETEASFGELDVPVYKKDEKDLRIPLLIYHAFQTPELDAEDDIYGLFSSQARFEEQITTLLDEGYTFLTLEDIYKYDKGYIGLPEKNITITMDDGWFGCYAEAFDILVKYEIPATIFVVEELVGTEVYFNWEQAKEMYDTGLVKIHVHGRRHVEATGYSKEQLIEDYNHAHEKIEQELGEKIQKIMAYPAGKSSPETIEWLKEAGFEVQVQTKYGTVNKTQSLDLTDLGRVRAEKSTGQRILNAVSY